MKKSLKQHLLSYRYKEESIAIGLLIIGCLSAFFTLILFLLGSSRVSILLFITSLFFLLYFYNRFVRRIRLRVSITTLRNAHATRKKRKHFSSSIPPEEE